MNVAQTSWFYRSRYACLWYVANLHHDLHRIAANRVLPRMARSAAHRDAADVSLCMIFFTLSPESQDRGVSRDVNAAGSAISDFARLDAVHDFPDAAGNLHGDRVLVVSYDLGFAVITLITLAAYITWTIMSPNCVRVFTVRDEADTQASSRAVDSLLNFETVKYFNNEKLEADRYDSGLKNMKKPPSKAEDIGCLTWPSTIVALASRQ